MPINICKSIYMGKWLFFLSFLPVLISFWAYVKRHEHWSAWLLVLGAFLLRMAVAVMDPFLHDWDEKFHALVAKNMMTYPFKPMLRIDPVLPYDYTAWCCNHIWVHKQPLFLWQMALSMKIFGVNEIAVRLPSALLSAAMVWCVYRIAYIWTNNFHIAYFATLLNTFAYYQIEMVSGKLSLDHNDLVFTAYVAGSIWAFCEYTKTKSFRWVIVTGCLVGCAILVKWLTGLLVFGGWGLWVLLDKQESKLWKNYRDILIAFTLSLLISLPWQFYIMKAFPKESAWEYSYNYKHVTEKLGAFTSADWTFYFNEWSTQYGILLLPFLLLGLLALLPASSVKSRLTVPMLSMAVVVYAFFSFVVQTKMPAFAYTVCPIVLIIIAIGIAYALNVIEKPALKIGWTALLVLLLLTDTFKPRTILDERKSSNEARIAKINNTNIFKSLDQKLPTDYVVFNCRSFEDVDLRFYNGHNGYHWFPEQHHLDSLLATGHKIAAFQSHNGQNLPEYLLLNPKVIVIKEELK